jgi:hypothetical protein
MSPHGAEAISVYCVGTPDGEYRCEADKSCGRRTTMDGQKFRRRAEFLLACANQMNDPEAKAGLERMAAHWIRMAEEADRKQSPDDTTQQQQQVQPNRIGHELSP